MFDDRLWIMLNRMRRRTELAQNMAVSVFAPSMSVFSKIHLFFPKVQLCLPHMLLYLPHIFFALSKTVFAINTTLFAKYMSVFSQNKTKFSPIQLYWPPNIAESQLYTFELPQIKKYLPQICLISKHTCIWQKYQYIGCKQNCICKIQLQLP